MKSKSRTSRRSSRSAACRRCKRSACKCSRRNRRGQSGGWVVLNPADINDTTMQSAGKLNLAQGGEYNKMHANQHGGGVLEGAPVGTTGVLDSSLRGAAHLDPLDKSLAGIQGMSDQAGGGRRRSSRKGRKASRRSASRRSSRKGRKASRRSAYRKGRRSSRRSRRQRGGMYLNPSDVSTPGTLLPDGMAQKAIGGMNPEWKLAENPMAFAPKA